MNSIIVTTSLFADLPHLQTSDSDAPAFKRLPVVATHACAEVQGEVNGSAISFDTQYARA